MNPTDPSNQPPLDPWAPAPLQAAPAPAPDQAVPAAGPDQAVPAPQSEPESASPTATPQQSAQVPLNEPITEPLPEPILSASPASQPAAPAAYPSAPAAPDAPGIIPPSAATPPTTPVTYSPTPEVPSEWQRQTWGAPPATTPESWFEPAAPAAVVAPPAKRRGAGAGTVFVTAVLAAVLASAGTYAAISASGALDKPAPTVVAGATTGTNVTQPITIDEQSATISAAAEVGPAVVRIVTAGTDPNDQTATSGIGSGVIFDSHGWILTNHHVVADTSSLTVQLKDGRQFQGTIYGIDTLTDLAVVKVDATGLPTAPLGDSSAIKVGELAIAIGSPLGTYSNSVTSGIVSATGRSIDTDTGTINNLIQTDAAINPGNSGGPLVDALGKVIGINTAVATNAQGIGFSIPIDIAKPIMQQAIAGQPLARPWIGIRYETIDYQLQQQLKLPVAQGALVNGGQDANNNPQPGVVAGSPADKAGVKDGDIVTAIEGIAIDGDHPLDAVLTQFAPGRTVTLAINRNGKTIELQLTLGTRPTTP